MERLISALGVTIILSACQAPDTFPLSRLALGADGSSQTALSERQAWAASELTAPVEGDWVASFNDPMLEQLVDEALTRNFSYAAAKARLDQARALARRSNASRLPTLNGVLSGTRGDSVIELPTGLETVETERLGLSLEASWEADIWGRLRDQARAGRLDAEASEADLAGARLIVAANVAQAWYALVEARLLRQLSEDEVDTQTRSYQLTLRRFESGLSGALDVRLAKSALASAEAARARSSNGENDAKRALEVLLGRYPGAEIEAADKLPGLTTLSGAGAPGELLARRPDLRASEVRLIASGLRAREARKAFLPRLTLTGSAGTSREEFSELFDSDFLVKTIAGSLLQPIFQGGALKAEAQRTQAVRREAMADYADVIVNAYREVEDALDAEGWLIAEEAARQIAADEASAAQRLAERNYSRGTGTIFDLLDAQSRRISADSALIQVRRARTSNRVALHLALGGEFQTRTEFEASANGANDGREA